MQTKIVLSTFVS